MDLLNFEHEAVVAEDQAGERLDCYLQIFPFSDFDSSLAPSRAVLQKWISEGFVLINGLIERDKSHRVKSGDRVSLKVTINIGPLAPPPEPLEINIVYRDPHFVILDKPPGITSHPMPGALSGSVVNFLIHNEIPLPPTSDPLRPGIVHRLDKNTSGLMIVASTDMARLALVAMIKRREVHREYLGIVYGHPPLSGTIDAWIQRDERDRRKMKVGTGGAARDARTHYKVLEQYRGFSLVRCVLDTGRTHQIRVHMSHIGYPIAGDPFYGGRKASVRIEQILKWMTKKDQNYLRVEKVLIEVSKIITADEVHLLHAARLSFPHPITKEPLEFTAPPHEKFQKVLDLLRMVPHNT
jgi:23S rRNA pseudouridine1911/1915/1917 synthase